VIHGTADRLIPPANSELLAGAIPDVQLAWLEGAGHVFTTDRTEDTIELVLKFLGNGR
jgi:pimeloyl-ACP methyl ester carboxylesterase